MKTPGKNNLPRPVWILALVLILAGGFLWKVRSDRPSFDYGLGGPLLQVSPEQIDGLLLTHSGAQYRLDRVENGGWALTGAMTDFVNAPAMEQTLVQLTSALGGPLLPGTEPEDRRYDFNALDAVRLTVFALDGSQTRLSLGAANPVTGMVYASGAGRRACFPVTPVLKQLLRGLPQSVRNKTLLPPFRFDSVTGLEVGGGRFVRNLERHGEHWWIRVENPTFAGLDPLVKSYQAQYSDRHWEREQGTWIMADSDAVQLLLFEISSLLVRSYVPPSQAEANLANWKLDPPYRRVILSGEGLNPLSTNGSSDQLEVAFGFSLDGKFVPAKRLENYLMIDEMALRTLEMPTSDLIATEALTFPVVRADSILVHFEGTDILGGHRDPKIFAGLLERMDNDVDRVDGRSSWVVDFPIPPLMKQSRKTTNVRLQTLVIELERIPILAVLPPAGGDEVFHLQDRSRVTVYGAALDGSGSEVVEFGWLNTDRLPAGSPPLARVPEGEQPAALWLPRTGQLLQIPAQTLVTIRNLARQ